MAFLDYLSSIIKSFLEEAHLLLQSLTYLADMVVGAGGVSSFTWLPTLFVSVMSLAVLMLILLRIIGR